MARRRWLRLATALSSALSGVAALGLLGVLVGRGPQVALSRPGLAGDALQLILWLAFGTVVVSAIGWAVVGSLTALRARHRADDDIDRARWTRQLARRASIGVLAVVYICWMVLMASMFEGQPVHLLALVGTFICAVPVQLAIDGVTRWRWPIEPGEPDELLAPTPEHAPGDTRETDPLAQARRNAFRNSTLSRR